MSDSIEALGGVAEAGLVASNLDGAPTPGTINAAEIADARHQCANCGQHPAGNFCSNCGQQAHVHRSLAHVGEEFLHGITHFDGKAWQTLPMLLFRPGQLTRDYIMGKRTRYIAPVPLFLLVVFLMFFVFSFVHLGGGGGAVNKNGEPLSRADAIQQLPKVDAQLHDLDLKIATARRNGGSDGLPGLLAERVGVVAARDAVKARANDEITNPVDLPGAIAAELGSAGANGDVKLNMGNETLNEKVRKALKNPELVLYKIQGKAYKLSFLLVPLSLPWLWLMFAWRRDVRMYDHAVFALYSISFMSLLFVTGSIAVALQISLDFLWFLLIFVAPVAHMYVQLKGTYALGRFGAAWRTCALSIAALLSLSLYAGLMVIIGVLD